MTPSERDELWSEWYRIDPDSLERLIRDMPMPQREEFHNLLIKKHNRSQPT